MNLCRKMIRRAAIWLVMVALGQAAPAAAQSLTLTDAIARARAQHPDARGAAEAEREAAQRVTQARAGFLPKVDFVESWQRGNQPVFAFGSLLAQRRFTAADFAVGSLNHPDPIDNFRSAVTIEQALFDGATRASAAAADVGHDMAATRRAMVDQDLAVKVTDAFGRVLLAAAVRQSASAAVETARADRELAGNRRDAGLVTDADVLEVELFLSRAQAQVIHAAADEQIARGQLNELMGEPLDAVFALDRSAAVGDIEVSDPKALEAEALEQRPDVKLAAQQEQLAAADLAAARAAFLPQVAAHGTWELNGSAWNSRASSWVVGASARINLLRGFADKARLTEAQAQATRRALEHKKTETAARLDVHIARARLEAARASETVGRAAVDQARESRRAIRDRYEAGLTDVASLLRSAEAVVQAETQQVAAQVAVLSETAALARSLGRR
jgi:outer membrane protein TolC